jgi:hypothetical protein
MRISSADATGSPSVFRRISMRARLSSMCKLHVGETPNMALQTTLHNRTNVRFEKIVGTKLESLPQIFGEYFCASGGYEGNDFSELFFDPTRIEISTLARAD